MALLKNRLSQLFQPPQYTDPGMSADPDNDQHVVNPLSYSVDAVGSDNASPLSKLYQTPLLDKFKDMIGNAPNPNDYTPDRTQRVLAAIAGMGAGAGPVGIVGGAPIGFKNNAEAQIGTQDAILNAPYDRAMKNYSLQAGLMGKGADIEERGIAQQRMAARDEALASAREESNRIREELGQAKHDLDVEKNDNIRQQKENELQEKIRQADMRASQAEQKLAVTMQGQENTKQFKDAQIEFLKIKQEAAESQHALDNARNDAKLEESKRLHDAEIKKLTEGAPPVQTTTEKEEKTPAKPGWKIPFTNYEIPGTGTPEQTKKITETTSVKGPVTGTKPSIVAPVQKPGTTKMRGPDGNNYDIPNDKVEDAKKNRMVVVQ